MKVTEIGRILKEEIDKAVYDHHTIKDFVIMALMSRENIVIQGPTGVAKTYLAEALAKILGLEVYFHQGSKFTREDQILGRTTVSKKQKESLDVGVRSIDENIIFLREPGAYTACRIGIYDEFNRDNEGIRNASLRIMNEKKITVWNKEKERFEEITIPLISMIALMNHEDFSAEEIPDFQIDRFGTAVLMRNIFWKKYNEQEQSIEKGIPIEERVYIDALDDAMEASRMRSDDPLAFLNPGKVPIEMLDEAYEYIAGKKKIDIPLMYLRAMRIFLELVAKTYQLSEKDALFTDRALISKMYKYLRVHALYHGRKELSWEDLTVLFGFFTTRIDRNHHGDVNKLTKLFAEALASNHPDAKKAREEFKKADIHSSTGTGKTKDAHEHDRQGKVRLERLKQFFLSMKNLISNDDIQSFDELHSAEPLQEISEHFEETKSKETPSGKERKAGAPEKKISRDQGKPTDIPQEKESQKDGDTEMNAAQEDEEGIMKPDGEGKELSYNPAATEGGPESRVIFENDPNFDVAHGARRFFDTAEKHLQKFKTRVEEKDMDGKSKFLITADNLEELARELHSAEPTTLLHFFENHYPLPLVDFKTRTSVYYVTARDRSYSMIELSKWASELVLAIHEEAPKRRRNIGHIEFSDKIFKAGKQDDLFVNDPSFVESLMKQVQCQGETNYNLLFETVLNNVLKYQHLYGNSLKVISFITDGVPTKAAELVELLQKCRKESIIIMPIYVFDPMAMQAGTHFKGATEEDQTLIYPVILKNIARLTEGMCWWGIQDHETGKTALVPETEGLEFAMNLIRIRGIQTGDPNSTWHSSEKEIEKQRYANAKAAKMPFDTKKLLQFNT